MNTANIRKDFPILKRKINKHTLKYLDNAATTQKPNQVINTLTKYYKTTNANIHRGIYTLSEEATEQYEQARKTISKFINSKPTETIFTKNTTDSINTTTQLLQETIKKNDEITILETEHHSNLIPWQQLTKNKQAKLQILKINKQGEITNPEKLTKKTKILAINTMSNFLGIKNNIKEIIKKAKENETTTILDCAQTTPHTKTNFKKLNADFIAFSAHKMLGPTGIGILCGKEEKLEQLKPTHYGGGTVTQVTYKETKWQTTPWKHEPGTPNIADAIAFSTAIKYLEKIGMEKIENHIKKLSKYAHEQIQEIPNIQIYTEKNAIMNSFNIKNINSHDIASLLDKKAICIRAGTHCIMPYLNQQKIKSSLRASYYVYNTKKEIDEMIKELKKINKKLS